MWHLFLFGNYKNQEFNFMPSKWSWLCLCYIHLTKKEGSLEFMKQQRLNHDAAVPSQRYSAVLESRDGAGHVR